MANTRSITIPPAVMRQREAEQYIGMGKRWLDSAPIPKVDLRKPGALRPVWRWRRDDLDAFLSSRLVRPGQVNPQANP